MAGYFQPYIEGIEPEHSSKLRRAIFLALALSILIVGVYALIYKHTHAFSSGSGTWNDPYIITTCAQLEQIVPDDTTQSWIQSNQYYELGNDIDCSGISSFIPIGAAYDGNGADMGFSGSFNGEGHTISNLHINSAGEQSWFGLFSIAQGDIRNFTISNATVTATSTAGFVAGLAESAIVGVTVKDSTMTDTIPNAGGIVGINEGVLYADSVSSTSISVTGGATIGNDGVGGIAGNDDGEFLDDLYSSATITGDPTGAAESLGGIVGNAFGTTMQNVIFAGTTTQSSVVSSQVGGIIGSVNDHSAGNDTSTTTIKNAYFSGTTLQGGFVGGFVNGVDRVVIDDSFSYGSTTKASTSGGGAFGGQGAKIGYTLSDDFYFPTGTGQSRCIGAGTDVAEGWLSTQCTTDNTASYYDSSSNLPLSKWDFVNIWQTNAGTLPLLLNIPYTAPGSPTSISSCATLGADAQALPAGWYQLSSDINCSGVLMPFATSTTNEFLGILDGNGHSITNISVNGNTIPSSATVNQGTLAIGGLFDELSGLIENVTVIGNVTGSASDLGGIIGNSLSGVSTFNNLHSNVNVTDADPAGNGNDAGIIANVISGTLEECSYGGTFDGNNGINGDNAGLIALNNFYEVIDNSSTTASASITGGQNVGGIGGEVFEVVGTNLSSAGTITGNKSVGGIFGDVEENPFSPGTTISNSTSKATILNNGSNNIDLKEAGGFVGSASGLILTNDIAEGTISVTDDLTQGGDDIGGLVGDLVSDSNSDIPIESEVNNSTSFESINLIPSSNPQTDFFSDVGGIVGYSDAPVFTNPNPVLFNNDYAAPTITIGSVGVPSSEGPSGVGAIVGEGDYAEVENSSSGGSIAVVGDASNAFNLDVGGFAGFFTEGAGTNSTSILTNDFSTTTVTVSGDTNEDVGGFAGELDHASSVFQSYASSTVSIDGAIVNNVGGFTGFTGDATTSQIFANGTLTITDVGNDGSGQASLIGGLIGDALGTTINDSYSQVNTSITSQLSSGEAGFEIAGLAGEVDFDNSNSIDSVLTNTYSTGFVHLSAAGSAFYDGVGGSIGSSTNSTNGFINSFAASPISAPNVVNTIGAFIGSYTGGETLTNDAYDSTRGSPFLCTGVNGSDPGWCTAHTTSSDFYSTSKAPLSSWNFVSNWDSHLCTYPTLHFFASLFGGICGGGGSTPPTVTTGSNSSVSNTSQNVIGDLTSTGSATVTKIGFVFGTTTTYTATSTSNGSFSTGLYNTNLTGLACNTTYHYDAYAFSSAGTAYGSDATFTTAACGGGSTPPSVTTGSGSSITTTTVTLGGTLVSTGTDSVTAEGFNYGPTTSYGSTVSNSSAGFSAGAFSKAVSSLTCGTTYHFEAFATSIDGTGDGSDQTFSTSACPVNTPSGPTSGGSGQIVSPPTPPAPPVTPPTPPVGPTTPPGGTSGTGGNKPTLPVTPPPPPVVPPQTPVVTVTPPAPAAPVTAPTPPISSTPPLDPLAILEFVFHATANTLNSGPGKAVAAAGILVTALGSLMAFLPDLETLGDVPALVARGSGTLFAFGFLRKPRGEQWGTVYDSVTRRPLDPAVVTLYDEKGNQLKTAITDMDGRFAFLVDAGVYSLTAEKGVHTFPATTLPVDEPVYINRYTGGPITMDQPGVLIRDIPLDPTGFDWNEEEKFKHGLFKFYSRFDRPLAYLSYAFSICGAIAAIVSVVVDPSPLNIALVILYIIIAILYLAGLGPRLYGIVKAADGTPLAYALIKASARGSTGSGPHTVTDRYGRYYLLTPPGKGFNVSVEQLQPDHTTYKPVWRGYLPTKRGYVNRVIKTPANV